MPDHATSPSAALRAHSTEGTRDDAGTNELDPGDRWPTCGVSPLTWTARSGRGRGCCPVQPTWSPTCGRQGSGSSSRRIALGTARACSPPAGGAGRRRDGHGSPHAVRPGRRRSQAAAGAGAGPGDRHRRGGDGAAGVGAHGRCRSIDGKRPRPSSSGSTTTSATTACARRRRAVAAGAMFFAINLDARFPVGPNLFDPGCGALAEAIAVAGGSPADRDRQARAHAVSEPPSTVWAAQPRQAAMVGDSTASDIAGAAPPECSRSGSTPSDDESEASVRRLEGPRMSPSCISSGGRLRRPAEAGDRARVRRITITITIRIRTGSSVTTDIVSYPSSS